MALWSWFLSCSENSNDRISNLTAIVVSIIIFILLFRFVLMSMYVKITIDNIGVKQSNLYSPKKQAINWCDVTSIYFYEEHWRGRKSCEIVPKVSPKYSGLKQNKFILPVNSVDEKKLVEYLPEELWANNPWR